jgi:hypothetical protein
LWRTSRACCTGTTQVGGWGCPEELLLGLAGHCGTGCLWLTLWQGGRADHPLDGAFSCASCWAGRVWHPCTWSVPALRASLGRASRLWHAARDNPLTNPPGGVGRYTSMRKTWS